LAVLSAFTASNKACSQVAASPEGGGGGAAATVTVTCWVTVPAALVADRVKIVVEAGLTGALPEAGREPIPGDMLTDATPVTFQLRLEFPLGLMLGGVAMKERIAGNEGGGAATTVTITCWVTVPAVLVADRVKVVVEAGLTIALPEAGREPIPGDMLTDVAPVTFQLRLEFPPGLMLEGLAVRERITGKVVGGKVVGGRVVGGRVVGGRVVGGRVVGGKVAGGEVAGGEVAGGEVTSIVND